MPPPVEPTMNGSGDKRIARRRGLVARAVAVVVLSLAAILGPVPSPSVSQTAIPNECPEMTDSIHRLFRALLGRGPTVNEAYFWNDIYMRAEMNLPQIADRIMGSAEFNRLHGDVTTREFVLLMYRSTEREVPIQEVLHHWTRALNNGYTRGEMALGLTETSHWVAVTGTARPLSGYLRWYPPGTHWYCGSGSRQGLSIQPLVGDAVHVDRLLVNRGTALDQVSITTIEAGVETATIVWGALAPVSTDYRWFGTFRGDGFYGDGLNITVADTTRWTLVFYNQPIGVGRLGWVESAPGVGLAR